MFKINGITHSTIESSGETLGFQKFDLNSELAEELSLEAVGLRGHQWISITEVCGARVDIYFHSSVVDTLTRLPSIHCKDRQAGVPQYTWYVLDTTAVPSRVCGTPSTPTNSSSMAHYSNIQC